MRSLFPLLAAMFALGVAAGEVDADTPVRAPVERLNAALLDVMRSAESLGFEGRLDRFSQVLGEVYDYRRMAGVAIGQRAWSSLEETQKDAYAEAFAELSAVTYAARFAKTASHDIVIDGVEPGPQGALVRTRIVRANDEDVRLDYRVRLDEGTGDARIVDVVYDGGVSELAQKRSEYAAAFKNGGFDGLMSGVRAAIERLRPS